MAATDSMAAAPKGANEGCESPLYDFLPSPHLATLHPHKIFAYIRQLCVFQACTYMARSLHRLDLLRR